MDKIETNIKFLGVKGRLRIGVEVSRGETNKNLKDIEIAGVPK